MMKLNIRPSIKKQEGKQKQQEPKFTVAHALFLSFLPNDLDNIKNRFMRLTKGQNLYKPHQNHQEMTRRVKNGQGGTKYHKRNVTNVIHELPDEQTGLIHTHPVCFQAKKFTRSRKRTRA